MATKERLHRLVEELPEEWVPEAERALAGLRLPRSLRKAPWDDEPDNDDFDGGLTEAREQIARGETISHDQLKRELGYRRGFFHRLLIAKIRRLPHRSRH